MADLVSPCPGPEFQERFHGPEGRTEVGSAGPSLGTAVPVWLEAVSPPRAGEPSALCESEASEMLYTQ